MVETSHRSISAARLGLLLLLGPVQGLCAQTDTLIDVERLRAEVRAHPDSFPVLLALGRELVRTATENEKDWRQRGEARQVLDRAVRLRPQDPRPFLAIGALLRKQGLRPDAMRVLRRAEERSYAADTGMSPAERASVHLEMGLIYEVWWEDGEHLGMLPSDFTRGSCSNIQMGNALMSAPSAPRANLVLYNFACPAVFDELMERWEPLGMYETDFGAMIGHFREALRLEPTATLPAFRLLRHLAAARAWEEYLEVAEPLARRLPTDPNVLIFLGLAYHQTGRWERADSAFALALEHATPALREELLQPSQFLRRQDSVTFVGLSEEKRATLGDVFWRARDPLFLTVGNERLAEHLARWAFVEVAYSIPQSQMRGRWTDRGSAWLRYGRPLQIRALGGASGAVEFWDYGAGSPDLVFTRQRGYRYARADELTSDYLRYARDRVPELYAPAHPRLVAAIPFQAAAFRNSDGASVLEVYAALPAGALRQQTDAPEIETGVFVVTGDFWESRAALRGRRALPTRDSLLDAIVSLPPGSYVVSLEAMAGAVAAQHRQRVELPSFRSTPALSDLLLVERFGSEPAQASERTQLVPTVSRTSHFPAGAPIGVVWEIYNLTTDSAGVARYRVKLETADTKHDNTAIEGLRDAVGRGGAPENRVEWEASRAPRSDGTVVEYLSIRLPNARAGSYRMFVTVTDQATGRSTTVHRPLAVTQ